MERENGKERNESEKMLRRPGRSMVPPAVYEAGAQPLSATTAAKRTADGPQRRVLYTRLPCTIRTGAAFARNGEFIHYLVEHEFEIAQAKVQSPFQFIQKKSFFQKCPDPIFWRTPASSTVNDNTN